MKRIAVLLTVFNRKDSTISCLENLCCQQLNGGITLNVYLTNDGCTDGTPEAVKSKFPEVHIINGDGNLFWNRGMYRAWQEAAKEDYDYYLWLNDDTYLLDHAVNCLVETSEMMEDAAIIIGSTCDTKETKATYGGRRGGKLIVPNGKTEEADCFNGNIVLVPRSVYQKLGNLDHYFTHSKGDFDYGMRAKEAGIKMVQVGKYLGKCDEHPTLDKWCNPDVPFRGRWKMLHRPNGMPPKETFHFEKKHLGLLPASFHYCTIYLRCLFPCLWRYKSKQFL